MSNAHGWAAGPGGALTESVLGIVADIGSRCGGGGGGGGQPTSFIVAPQPSGLKWCLGRLSFADDHNVDVKWNMTLDSFTLGLDLSNAHPQACGRVELPLFQGKVVEIEMDGVVVKKQSVSDEALQPHHVIDIPTPLRSHVFVVRVVKQVKK